MDHTPMELAEAFIRFGELDDALDVLNQHLEATPGDENARRMRLAVLLQLGGDNHLRAALDDSQRLANRSTGDYTRRSVILERLGDLDGALAAMAQALALSPGDERLLERQLHLLLAQGNLAEARDLVEAQPKSWRWLQWAADLAVRSGDSQSAVALYDTALSQFEQRFDTLADRYAQGIKARLLLARANAYRRLKQIEQAEADYLAAAAIVPDDPTIPFNRGLLAAQRGDLDTAVALCSSALASASDTLQAHMRENLRQPEYHELAARLQGAD